jgi:hypothetical protein
VSERCKHAKEQNGAELMCSSNPDRHTGYNRCNAKHRLAKRQNGEQLAKCV